MSDHDGLMDIIKRDFSAFTGEIQVAMAASGTGFTGTADTEKEGRFIVNGETVEEFYRDLWYQIAEKWLLWDGKPARHNLQFCFHDGSIRGVQNKYLPMPPECSDEEMDIRHRMAFGWKGKQKA